MIIFYLQIFFLFLSAISVLIGAIGLIRFPDVYSKIHSASITDVLGCFFIVLFIVFSDVSWFIKFKSCLVLFLLWITSPLASQAIAESSLLSKIEPKLSEKYKDKK